MGKAIVFMILIIQASLLNAQDIDTSYYLEFNTKGLIQTEEGYDLNNHILKNEFTLLGEYTIKYSVEIKTSSNKSKIFGNRSYAQKSENEKKDKSGYYLAINFEQISDTNRKPKLHSG